MAQPLEIEVKLAATPAMLERLRAHAKLAGEGRTTTLITTYFDTNDGRLRHGGAALRIRNDGASQEQTLKLVLSGATSVRRNEWNVPVSGPVPEVSEFPTRPRSTLNRLLGGEPVEPVAVTRIERTTRRLHFGRSAIEIAFDVGAIEAADRTEAVCELELELVEGQFADVLALVLTLPIGPELSWSVSSKADRCHALAYGLPPAAAHARPVKLSPAMDVARGFQTIAWSCLEQLLANYPLVIATGDPEAVHQSRVAIRRLRAACSLFADIIEDEGGPVFRAELKAVASGLGPARDLHVLFERVASAARTSEDNFSEMLDHLANLRNKAVASAQQLLATEPFQRFLFEFATWLETGEWLSRKGETGGDQPLSPFAARVLSQRRRKLRQVHSRMADLADADRHRLRIQAKKLRYASAFLMPLFSDKKAIKHRMNFTNALGKLQDSLGELNDMVVASNGRAELFVDLDVITAARQATQLEELLATAEKSRRTLLKRAEKALAEIGNTPAWWKAG